MEYGVKVLFLPVGHPELNRIELMWANIKSYIRTENKQFTTTSVFELAKKRVTEIIVTDWIKAANHCIQIEDSYLANEITEHVGQTNEAAMDLTVDVNNDDFENDVCDETDVLDDVE